MKLKLYWDEPAGCTTPRGWCRVTKRTHPDRKNPSFDYQTDDCGALNVGNYLDYGPLTARGPNGETVHAVAFFQHIHATTGILRKISLGYCWFNSITEAKEFIVGNIRAYFGLPRAESAVTQPEAADAS